MSAPELQGGYYRSVIGADPAAGQLPRVDVPGRATWELISIRVLLTTNATVANRRLWLTVNDGTADYFDSGTVIDQTASVGWFYQWMRGLGEAARDTVIGTMTFPLPVLLLEGGHRVTINCTGLQAGDNFGAPYLRVYERLATGAAPLRSDTLLADTRIAQAAIGG